MSDRSELEAWARAVNFGWIVGPEDEGGGLAAMARPGLYRSLEEDLARLAALGVCVIVNLTEETLPPGVASRFRVEEIPIEALDAPTPEQVDRFCALVDAALARQERVVAHCLAGIGRTGAMAASYLVHCGLPPATAIAELRSRRLAIQNPEQEAAVHATELRRARRQP